MQAGSAGPDNIDAGNGAKRVIHRDEVAQRADIVDAVSGPEYGFVLAEPRNIPAQSNRGGPIIEIVTFEVRQDIGIRRVLADKLHLRQIRASRVEARSARA